MKKKGVLRIFVVLLFGTFLNLVCGQTSSIELSGWASEITSADVNNDGKNEISFLVDTESGEGGFIYLLDETGKIIWQKEIPNSYMLPQFSPVFGDLDNDGKMEVAYTNKYYNGLDSNLIVYNYEGNIKWSKKAHSFGEPGLISGSGFSGTPIIFDIDNDKNKEIISLEDRGILNVWDRNGNFKTGFPIEFGEMVPYDENPDLSYSSVISNAQPVIGDFLGDEKKEITIVINDYSSEYFNPVPDTGRVLIIDSTGEVVRNIKIEGAGLIPLVSADINKDEKDEIIFSNTRTYATGEIWKNDKLYAFKGDGSKLFEKDIKDDYDNHIPSKSERDEITSISIIDRNDENLGIVLKISNEQYIRDGFANSRQRIDILNSLGNLVCSTPYGLMKTHVSRPRIADINNDGKQEIIIGDDKYIFIFNSDCSLMQQINSPVYIWPSLSIENIGAESVALFGGEKKFYMMNLGGRYSNADWPQFQHDSQHTGRYSDFKFLRGDANNDANVNIADAIYILGYLFGKKPAPPAPFPNAGLDPTVDNLDCKCYGTGC